MARYVTHYAIDWHRITGKPRIVSVPAVLTEKQLRVGHLDTIEALNYRCVLGADELCDTPADAIARERARIDRTITRARRTIDRAQDWLDALDLLERGD